MALHSTLFCLLLSVALVSGSGPVPKYTRKVLDFSADNDQVIDSNGNFTSATLNAGALPESFTICSAFMVEAWTTEFNSARIFNMLGYYVDPYSYYGDGVYFQWGFVSLFPAHGSTQFSMLVISFQTQHLTFTSQVGGADRSKSGLA